MDLRDSNIAEWGFMLVVVAISSWIYSRMEQKRLKSFSELAAAQGLGFFPHGGDNRELFRRTGLKVFNQFPDGTYLANRLDRAGADGKPALTYFDCLYRIPHIASNRTTPKEFSLYLADFGEPRLPEFELVPKNLNMDVSKAFGFEKGIDLSEFPELASSYFMSGPDQERLSAFLRGGAARLLQETANLSIQSSGRYLAIFILYSVVSDSEIKTYLDGALELAAGLGEAAAGREIAPS